MNIITMELLLDQITGSPCLSLEHRTAAGHASALLRGFRAGTGMQFKAPASELHDRAINAGDGLRWALEQIEPSLDPEHQAAMAYAKKALD